MSSDDVEPVTLSEYCYASSRASGASPHKVPAPSREWLLVDEADVAVSERNLIVLLSKLYTPGSARTND